VGFSPLVLWMGAAAAGLVLGRLRRAGEAARVMDSHINIVR